VGIGVRSKHRLVLLMLAIQEAQPALPVTCFWAEHGRYLTKR
jgi:hypothetical protein